MVLVLVPVFLGSSPLARGTPFEDVKYRKPRGLIPARAGNTQEESAAARRYRAHPRSRGEHANALPRTLRNLGSSPLARGTLAILTRHDQPDGLIPARAGNTDARLQHSARTGAHPRSRGEHIIWDMAYGVALGSSPLARGTRLVALLPSPSPGLIPARAGNTCTG